MNTAMQIGGISRHEGRVWMTGLLLHGNLREGERLEAVGLATQDCVIDEVRVDGIRRPAAAGESCQVFLRDPDASFHREGGRLYLALVTPGSVESVSRMRVALTWASLRDEPLPAGPGFAPAAQPILTDTRVELRFVDITVGATLLKPELVRPVGGTDDWDLVLDRPLPLIPDFGFSMKIAGEFAAMGKVIGSAGAASDG